MNGCSQSYYAINKSIHACMGLKLLFYINMLRVIDKRKGLIGRNFSQASEYVFQVYQEFQIQLTDLTVENLLEQFTLAKHTGLEKPGKFKILYIIILSH